MIRPSRRWRDRAAAAAAMLLAAASLGCAVPATHPTLARADADGERPPLVPMRRFVADADWIGGFSLSPDGTRLLNSQVVGLDLGLVVRDAASGAPIARYAIGSQGRRGGFRAWLADSRHVVYTTDPRGDENLRIHVQDTADPRSPPWTVTPWPGVRSFVVGRGAGARLLFASNRRDRTTFDLYEADAADRTVREVARDTGDTRAWLIDEHGTLHGRLRRLGDSDGSDAAIELARPDGGRRTLRTVGAFDTWSVQRIDGATMRAWVLTNVGRDRIELVEVDLSSGEERVLGAHDTVDVGAVVFAGRSGPPVGYLVEPDRPRLHGLDPAFAAELDAVAERAVREGLLGERPVLVRPQSTSDDRRRAIVRAVGRFYEAELLWERDTGRLVRLDGRDAADAARWLSPQEPYSFVASDGRRIHGLLIRPRGVTGPVPLVVDIHGGPWTRDTWGPATFGPRQMLANRGYAVLQVNYRGSAGYGREHLWAGAHEYAGRLQRDIAEAVQWAVDAGVADRDRIGLLGGSFGGYSVLMQLIQQPHPYRCGVDVVGVADWPRAIEQWPRFWRDRHWFERFYGRPGDPAERARMTANSPVSRLDRISAPLLVVHGTNDVRVLLQDSIDVVDALRARGHPVTFLTFPDEGHAISKWRNRLALWREIEDTFARCLGGRSGGVDLYEWLPASTVRDPR